MYGVLVEVDLSNSEREEGLKHLREVVVPGVSQAPGFQSGAWLAPLEGVSQGSSLVLFDNEENARAASQNVQVGATPGPGVTVVRCEVREVAASA